MGVIGGLMRGAGAAARLTDAARGLSEAFRPNATAAEADAQATHRAALGQFGGEFGGSARGGFDRFVDGLNRLPRPCLAFGTLGLFVHAMVDPEGFAGRMRGLAYVPEPLWWLLGAIVGFYFGARELHYRRAPSEEPAPTPDPVLSGWHRAARAEPDPDANAALDAWRAGRG